MCFRACAGPSIPPCVDSARRIHDKKWCVWLESNQHCHRDRPYRRRTLGFEPPYEPSLVPIPFGHTRIDWWEGVVTIHPL